MVDSGFQRQANATSGFIRAYGLHWEAMDVDWDRGELLGRIGLRRPRLKLANFWKQNGIYILYNHYGPYYVGRTDGPTMSLGRRLKQHYMDSNASPHVDRWQRFSWFGWRRVLTSTDDNGLQNLGKLPRQLLTQSSRTVGDIEALLMHTLGTRQLGNKRDESFAAALRWEQLPEWDREHYLRA